MSIHFPDIPATFRNVPKTGGTSFKFWCRNHIKNKQEICDPDNPEQMPVTTFDKMCELWPNYGTTFGFVRNPYDRLVSIFHFLGQDAVKRIKKRKFNPNCDDVIKVPIEIDMKILFQYKRGFEDWIKNTHHDYDYRYAGMVLLNKKDSETQLYYYNNIKPDIVVKLENMDTEFKQVQDLLDCHAPPLFVNRSKHGPYQDYYNDDTRKIVYKWVEPDLDAFGYTF